MLGGAINNARSQELQNQINKLIKSEINETKYVDISEKKIDHYKELFNNIISNDLCFNISSEETLLPVVGEPFLDIFVDKYMANNERLVIAIQRVEKFFMSYDIVICVMTIEVKSNHRQFTIDPSSTAPNQITVN